MSNICCHNLMWSPHNWTYCGHFSYTNSNITMKCSFSSDHYEDFIVGMPPPLQPTHSNHLPDWQVAKTLIWMPGDTVLICTSMGGKPSSVSPANDQIYNDMMAIQSLLCLLRNQDERKTKQKKKKCRHGKASAVAVSHVTWTTTQKNVGLWLALWLLFSPLFSFFFSLFFFFQVIVAE